MKTIEEIYLSKTAGDLWDEFNKPSQSDAILSFTNGNNYNIRLIGPFINAERIFLHPSLELANKLSPLEFKMILQGNSNVCDRIVHKVLNSAPDNVRTCLHVKSISDIKSDSSIGKQIIETVNTLIKMNSKHKWQSVVLSNAVLINGMTMHCNPAIVCLHNQLCDQITNSFNSLHPHKQAKKISGLYAHNISISKEGKGFSSQYIVKLSDKEEFLPKNLERLVLNKGLLDIPQYVKLSNNKVASKDSMKGFIYRVVSDYKMSDELMKEVFVQATKIEDMNEMDIVDKNLSDLPLDSFEHRVSDNPICSLEL